MKDVGLTRVGPFDRYGWHDEAVRATAVALLLTGMLVACRTALAQSNMPDAQVEANVMKALAAAPDLASEAITTRTVYGTVTLSGSVRNETLRSKAENLSANASGVKKVVDELQVGSPASVTAAEGVKGEQAPAAMMLQSDGTYAPVPPATDGQTLTATKASGQKPAPGTAPATVAARNDPDADQALDQQVAVGPEAGPAVGGGSASGQAGYPLAQGAQQQNGYPPQDAYPQAGGSSRQGGYPQQQGGYPQNGYPQVGGTPSPYPQQGGYPVQGGYPQQQGGYSPPQGAYPAQGGYPQQQAYGSGASSGRPVWGGQVAGESVTVPAETLIRIRVNQMISSNHSQPGTRFDGIVVNDVVAGGAVAIPRGASVQGTVMDAKSSGALKGRGELSIELNSVTLGGKVYPIVTEAWAHDGADKTIETINRTAGFGVLGAVVGAVAGGGVGAAVGGGVGAAAGLGSSAASGRGQVIIPPEGVVAFHLAQPAPLQTVSEQEMSRLAQGVVPGADPRYLQRRPYGYPAPGYYGGAPAPGPYGYPQ